MLNNIGNIKSEFLIRMQGNTSVAFYTDVIINDWLKQAHNFTTAYKKWPFTEGRVSTTYTGVEEWNFEGYKTDSFRMIKIGGKRYEKKNFEDYQTYKEDYPNGTDKIFSDYGRTLFINPLAGGSGTLTAYGQYLPAELDTSIPTTETIFTPAEEEGNEAIIQLMFSYAKTREKKFNESEYHFKKAVEILDRIWERHEAEQFAYQTKNREMFKRIDVLGGDYYDDVINEDQF
jgi:hypothetical protein